MQMATFAIECGMAATLRQHKPVRCQKAGAPMLYWPFHLSPDAP